ncbi:membrane protein insertase YidC [Corynebacterium sp. HMSC064E08]|uniref:membrane protein insertase YidC n=1 Tax=Corynebacterium sp. HMSC064E08 TaxID=1739324 RepID=UPI0008A5B12D|nr:membrane protein insertase YidC [Corynebacterium sp. HMSC064E08]OFK31692.1 preprotein translocase YidC [Corynebacterium sp. HMSC064E08]
MVILEPFVWLVSFVLKAWHLLLASVFHLPSSLSWTLSLFLLVFTVRGALAFLAFQQFISARKTANLRPQLFMLKERYRRSIEPNSPQYVNFASKEMRKAEGIKTSVMLAPLFVQIPVIMGLVRMLRHMLRASEGPGLPASHNVGFISKDEISDFLSATFLGQPLPAYLRMDPAQLQILGGNHDSLLTFCIIGIVAAAFFTGFNLVVSYRRLQRTLDYSNSVSVFLSKFMRVMLIYAPLMILFAGFFGPTPVALIVYWVTNNFWTLTQNIILTRYVEKTYPLTDDFRTLQNHQKGEYESEREEKKKLKQAKRRFYIKSAFAPWKIKQHKSEYAAIEKESRDRRKAKQEEEYAQALKIAKVRYMVTQMRPGAQDNLPSLTQDMKISSGIVPPLPGLAKVRDDMKRQAEKAQKAQKRPKPILIAKNLGMLLGQNTKNMVKKATGSKESDWKRFRD